MLSNKSGFASTYFEFKLYLCKQLKLSFLEVRKLNTNLTFRKNEIEIEIKIART